MTEACVPVAELSQSDLEIRIDELSRILIDTVHGGASIGFLSPLTKSDAVDFWRGEIGPAVARGDRRLLGAFQSDQVVGTLQLVLQTPPNQVHRGEIAKMIVHPEYRGRGIGKALLNTAFKIARHHGKTLLTLDTRSGDVSEALYRSVGFREAGAIPGYALDPDGAVLNATTLMYRKL